MIILENFWVLFCSSFVFISTDNKVNTYCDRQYIEKPQKVYLKDEMLNSTMIQVLDQKTGKLVFGYFQGAIRNDTNYIFSRIQTSGDTILNHTYRRFKITPGIDSSVSKYICHKGGLLFYTYGSYWNGKIRVQRTINQQMQK